MSRIGRNPFQRKEPRMHQGSSNGVELTACSHSWARHGDTAGTHPQGSPKTQQEKLKELWLHHSHSPGKRFRHRGWGILGTKGSPRFQLLPQGRAEYPPGSSVGFCWFFKIKFAKCTQSQVLLLGHSRLGISEPQVFLGIREEP